MPQFTEIHSLTENPEMRRRREAFLAAELMKERTRSNQMLNGLDLASSSAGSPNGFRSLAALIKQDAGLAKQQGGELQALFSLVGDENVHQHQQQTYAVGHQRPTQWEEDQEALRDALSSREERTRHEVNRPPASAANYGGFAEWELDLARARQQKQREEDAEARRRQHESRENTRKVLRTGGGNVVEAMDKSQQQQYHHQPFVAKQRPWAAARRTIVPSGSRAVYNGSTREKLGNTPRTSGIVKSTDRMSELVNKYKM